MQRFELLDGLRPNSLLEVIKVIQECSPKWICTIAPATSALKLSCKLFMEVASGVCVMIGVFCSNTSLTVETTKEHLCALVCVHKCEKILYLFASPTMIHPCEGELDVGPKCHQSLDSRFRALTVSGPSNPAGFVLLTTPQ